MGENTLYKIFGCEEGDWYVVAKKEDNGKIKILYEGHHRVLAYEEILKDLLGTEIPIEERDMESGGYEPTEEDFKKEGRDERKQERRSIRQNQ